MYKLTIDIFSKCSTLIINWCLDLPQSDVIDSCNNVIGKDILFQGWVLTKDNFRAIPYVRSNKGKIYLSLNKRRKDVIEKVLNLNPNTHPQLKCGFYKKILYPFPKGTFGFEIQGLDYDAAEFSIEGSLKVLEGTDSWLFLDNDSNNSVSQFQGKLLLTREDQEMWKYYLNSFYNLAQKYDFNQAVLIAPTKEIVMSEYYPHKKGCVTPVDQLEAISCDKHNMVHPAQKLKDNCKRPYRVCDTHWTPKGALYSFLELLKVLGVEIPKAQALFDNDKYREHLLYGDLGSKIYPPRGSYEEILDGVSYRKWVCYDNHLPNIGRVILTHKKNALYNKKIIIFGSSSSYTMLDYVSRAFTIVIFIHSAGSIDKYIIQSERPDYVVAQTNGRFVIKSPSTDFDLTSEIQKKWSILEMKDQKILIKKQSVYLTKNGATFFDFTKNLKEIHH